MGPRALRRRAARHRRTPCAGDWEIIGPPELRDVDLGAGYFNPWAAPRPDETPAKEPPGNKPPPEKEPPSKKPPVKEPKQISAPREREPELDEFERFLVLLFLRRYVTYCARRARFAQMSGAARLHREVLRSVW